MPTGIDPARAAKHCRTFQRATIADLIAWSDKYDEPVPNEWRAAMASQSSVESDRDAQG